MTTENLFELASRQKLRFSSAKGDLTVEQLWDLPLIITSPTRDVKADLDTLARSINHELKAQAEESFVVTKANPAKDRLELALELVKHIIGVKLAEAEQAKKALENRAERQKLLAILGQKEDAALAELTPEQIKARLAALGE